VDIQTIPFKTTPLIITSLKGGDLQAMVEILAPMIPHIKSGNLRALAVTFDHRFAGLPDIPTLAEAGVPGYEASAWNGVAATAEDAEARHRSPQPRDQRRGRGARGEAAPAGARRRCEGSTQKRCTRCSCPRRRSGKK